MVAFAPAPIMVIACGGQVEFVSPARRDPSQQAILDKLAAVLDIVTPLVDDVRDIKARQRESFDRQSETDAKVDRLQDDRERDTVRIRNAQGEILETVTRGYRTLDDRVTESAKSLTCELERRVAALRAELGADMEGATERTISTRPKWGWKRKAGVAGAGGLGLFASITVIAKNMPLIVDAPHQVLIALHGAAKAMLATHLGEGG